MATLRSLDVRKPLLFERILRAWEKRPEMTLGQLLSGAVVQSAPEGMVLAHLLRMTDLELAEAVERFVLVES
jgi:hypothetical protein